MTKPIYQALGDYFLAEGVTTCFALLGDGNMHWATHLQDSLGVRLIHVRHEHNALGAAMGHWSATGEVGVASVTCGPGFTQCITALTSAAKGRIPLVVFAGETPLGARYYHQEFEQSPVARLCGAHYISAHSPGRMQQFVREAFYTARHKRVPVVLGVPYDMQKQPMPDVGAYRPSRESIPHLVPPPPDQTAVSEIAGLLAAARAPLIVGGRGVSDTGAGAAVERLAERTGALLANTLQARGLFDASPWSLGICGGYARPDLQPLFAESDLVVSFGASLGYYTLAGGTIFPNATVVKIGLDDEGLRDGLRSADIHLRADAGLTADAIARELGDRAVAGARRTDALAAEIAAAPSDPRQFQIEPGTLDPVRTFQELERVIPKDFDTICGTGHHAYYHTHMRGYDPRRYHHLRPFGAIGNSLSHAIGVAAARGDGRVVLFEGDGSLTMYIQELETIRRLGLKFLIVCANDGAYGAEIHKLREDGLTDRNAVFGRPDFAHIARGFGLVGETITAIDQFAPLYEEYARQELTMIWDVIVSDKVVNPSMRRNIAAGHGAR